LRQHSECQLLPIAARRLQAARLILLARGRSPRRSFDFGKLTLTLIYAIYVLGNLAALLIFGRLSDQIGRRLVTLPAVGIGSLSVVTFVFADRVGWLLAARVLSGLATGLASGGPLIDKNKIKISDDLAQSALAIAVTCGPG